MLSRTKSVVVTESCEMRIQEFDVPSISPDEALLRVELVSICASDIKIYQGTHYRTPFPIIPGHEMVGWVEAIGSKAEEEYHLQKGDRVTIEPYIPCRKCEYCLKGMYNLCRNIMTYGINISSDRPPYLWGAYGEFLYVAPGSKLHKISDKVPPEAACLSSVIGNGIRWVKTRANGRIGESIAIMGPGAQGLAATIAAKESGLDPIIVLGLAKDEKRMKLAREFGASHLIDIQSEDPAESIERITDGKMADIVIECSGSPAAFDKGLDLLKPAGRYVIVSLSGGEQVSFDPEKVVYKELNLYGGIGQAWNVEDAVKIINSQKYSIEKIITHTFPLNCAEEALHFLMNSASECIRIALKS